MRGLGGSWADGPSASMNARQLGLRPRVGFFGVAPAREPQFNILNSYQALTGADISSLEQERHDHLSLLCACTE